ncbi:MAG: 23S rRNA (adenine(2503)-C(2))-methyltransferase RlmN [Calditrichia bacterium]
MKSAFKTVDEIQSETLVGMDLTQLTEVMRVAGEADYRARQIYKWIYGKNVDSFQQLTNIPQSLRDWLESRFRLRSLQLEKEEESRDGTRKFLWKLIDGHRIESVLIPEGKRRTLCISSQVGCSFGCKFCATGTMGLVRNLTPGEIVEQVLQVNKIMSSPVTNVVFMGMGEPFLNYPRVVQACKILNDPEGVAISNRRITISTSGVIPKIYQYTDDGLPYKLAISLHAPNQALREKIMPIAKKFPLDELIAGVKYYLDAKKQNRVTFEYVLLHGVNDSPREARQLISLLSPLRCKLNLIPCNQNFLGFQPPSPQQLEEFYTLMLKAPFAVTVRKNRGEDITGACGQLAVEVQAKTIFMKEG